MRRKRSTPTKVKEVIGNTSMVDIKEMVTRQKVTKEKDALFQGELQRTTASRVNSSKTKYLRKNVTIAERRAIWRKIVGLTINPLREIVLLSA